MYKLFLKSPSSGNLLSQIFHPPPNQILRPRDFDTDFRVIYYHFRYVKFTMER